MADTMTLAEKPKVHGTIQKFDPFGFFDTVQQEFEHFWQHPFFAGFNTWPLVVPAPAGTKATFMPRADMYDKDGMLVITAELPGLTKDNVEVEVVDGDLVIKGVTTGDKEVKEAQYYRMERTSGAYYRRLPLPFEVTPDRITATLKDGVLEVKIPKPAVTTPTATKVPVA
jgi:HSP20 family protein